jgi:hypothetical protein
MSGIVDVGVKRGVGDRVAVGVAVGNSGVNVAMGVAEINGVGVMPAIVVCVAPAIMVDITAVPRTLRSSVGAGKFGAHAWAKISNRLIETRTGADFRILIISPSDHPKRTANPKTRNSPLTGWTF